MMRKLLFLLTAFFLLGGVRMSAQEAQFTLDKLLTEGDWSSTITSEPTTDGFIFGGEDPEKYAKVNEYEYLYLDLGYTEGDGEEDKCKIWVRFYNPMTKEKYKFYLYPDGKASSEANYTASYDIIDAGLYRVKIPDGARLLGAKCESVTGNFTVKEIYLTKRETPAVEAVPYTLDFSSNLKVDVPIEPQYIQTMGNVTLNYSTGEVDCTGYGRMYIYFNDADLRGCTSYSVPIEGTNLEPTLLITDAVNGEVGGIYYSRFDWNIQGDAGRKNRIGAIKYFCYEFSGSLTGTMTLKSITFTSGTAEALQAGYTSLKDVPYVLVDGITKVTPAWDLNAGEGKLVYGDGSGDISRYADITDYEELRIYTDVTKVARLFICEANEGQVTQIYSDNATYATSHPEEGYVSFDIASLPKNSDSGKVRLQSIKWNWGVSAPVEKIVLYRTPAATEPDYIITGLGVLQESVTSALADDNARLIDATGLTGMNYNLTSANPNCIFKAKSGVLTNTNNVMVDGTIANLSLTDGYDFAVPAVAEAKVTAARYTRSTVANKFGTVCLPYEVTIPVDGSVKFYGIKEINTENALVLEEKNGTLPAGTPAIVYSGDEVTSITLAKDTEGVLGDSQQGSVGNLTLVGSYEAKSIDAASDASKYYYGISNNQFVRATKTLNVKPFRAYITAEQGSGEANVLRLLIGDDDVTGNMEPSKAAPTVEAIYNLQGVRLSTMQKGMNILQMSNGQSVKVLVK